MKYTRIVLCATAVLMAGGTLVAHHGEIAYDTDKVVEVKNAVVTKLNWINPHVFLQFEAKDAQGNVVQWVGEGGSPNALGIRGWTQTTVVPGDIITVEIWQSKTGRPVGRFHRIVRADGKSFYDSATMGEFRNQREQTDAPPPCPAGIRCG